MTSLGTIESATFLPYLLDIIKKIIDIANKMRIKKELYDIIREPLERVENSYSIFLDNTAKVIGYFILSFANPPNMEKKVEEVFISLKDSYKQLIRDVTELFKYINAHRDEFRDVFDIQNWLVIEAFMEAFNKEAPDWSFLLNHEKVRKNIKSQQTTNNKSLERMIKEFEEFKKETGLDKCLLDFLKIDFSFLSSDEFWNDITKHLLKSNYNTKDGE